MKTLGLPDHQLELLSWEYVAVGNVVLAIVTLRTPLVAQGWGVQGQGASGQVGEGQILVKRTGRLRGPVDQALGGVSRRLHLIQAPQNSPGFPRLGVELCVLHDGAHHTHHVMCVLHIR